MTTDDYLSEYTARGFLRDEAEGWFRAWFKGPAARLWRAQDSAVVDLDDPVAALSLLRFVSAPGTGSGVGGRVAPRGA